ncbi:mast cell protease 8 precursor [Mus musculus]|uniref:Mast cell protease 8 n=4 Tax=Mus musculus TaxID=10090 RepID=MCPT8_MOUSE|nr:mast cell protease 8 precursor [Mus musculus]P43430.1 RecName: Full=Mast cell protease 8; Short=mMCP-8; Flags: Precursor [Mus musculus]AAD43899.1 mast cell protease 8 [Mus musculus]AAI19343.1 Mast cell protease 8 [Mus musculus]AAI20608.1 Mast cell protease 8 [Mus musculus]EDL36216.1 mast cell protease 8 [Mus musculus]CAA55291.1 serine protease [Mus musculus]|eukprot:NP_032598.1 mast cell protease 8 precursor [Mus musculus]
MFLLLVLLVAALPVNAEGGEIIWGTESKPHSRPYMAYIRFNDSKSVYRCGGFLVARDIVMTAAHCNGKVINVTLGIHNLKKKKNTQLIPVSEAIPHESFDNETLVNDIMLLKLERKAQLNSAVDTIALPKSKDWVKPGQVCTVAGWGKLANCTLSDTLQEVNLEVQKGQKCRSMSQTYNDSIQLCVGNPSENKATGKGDSGGPFVCNGVVQGIVSCRLCTGTLPRVFTRISSFMPWIRKTMKLLQQP